MKRKRYQSIQIASAAALLVVLCGGCDQSRPKLVKVQGNVTVGGKPVASGFVTFEPLDGGVVTTGRSSTGTLDANGFYRLSTFTAADGAPPGEYLVSVEGALDGASSPTTSIDPNAPAAPLGNKGVPAKYSSAKTSGLKAVIPADASETTIDFPLQP